MVHLGSYSYSGPFIFTIFLCRIMIFLSSVTFIFKSYMGGDKRFSSAVDRLICMSALHFSLKL